MIQEDYTDQGVMRATLTELCSLLAKLAFWLGGREKKQFKASFPKRSTVPNCPLSSLVFLSAEIESLMALYLKSNTLQKAALCRRIPCVVHIYAKKHGSLNQWRLKGKLQWFNSSISYNATLLHHNSPPPCLCECVGCFRSPRICENRAEGESTGVRGTQSVAKTLSELRSKSF